MGIFSIFGSIFRKEALYMEKTDNHTYQDRFFLFGIDPKQALALCEMCGIGDIDVLDTNDGVTLLANSNTLASRDGLRKAITEKLNDYLIGPPGETIEQILVDILKKKNIEITTAESVTGGMIASRIINVPGASKIIKQAYVVYDRSTKASVLDIPVSFIERHGEVSLEVAREMARKAQLLTKSDIVVSTTGYAGPSGKEESDPVGTVCFGFSIFKQVTTLERVFSGTRNDIRQKATAFALGYVINKLTRNGDDKYE
jgi:nicotinamide-nucleotide amidase